MYKLSFAILEMNKTNIMKIITFDTQKGIFDFELNDLETEFHSHPAIEIILAQEGHFTLSANNLKYSNIRFAIIEKNISHKVEIVKGIARIFMCENFNTSLAYFLKSHQIRLENGVFTHEKAKTSSPFLKLS